MIMVAGGIAAIDLDAGIVGADLYLFWCFGVALDGAFS